MRRTYVRADRKTRAAEGFGIIDGKKAGFVRILFVPMLVFPFEGKPVAVCDHVRV